jgi:hypothetical protein
MKVRYFQRTAIPIAGALALALPAGAEDAA